MPSQSWSNPALASLAARGQAASDAASEPSSRLDPHRRKAYRDAASVLASFSPGALRPFGMEGSLGEALDYLLEDSIQTYGRRGDDARWTLRIDVRRDALRSLASQGALPDALEANHDRPQTAVQQIFEDSLRGKTIDPANRSMEDLAAISQVSDWVSGILPNVPAAAEVQDLIDRKSLLEPMETLLKDGFAGRVSELDRLRNHIQIVPAESTKGKVSRRIRNFLGTNSTVLVLWGCGGIGKSTLMAKFIVEHVQERKFPYGYLDFDSATIGVTRLQSLLIQLLAQIGIQYPEQRPAIARFRRRFDPFLKSPEPTSSQPSSAPAPDLLTKLERSSLRHLARIVQALTMPPPTPNASTGNAVPLPFLVVLDTFENLHESSEARTRKIGAFARFLESLVPSLRVVVSGRNNVKPLLSTDDFDVEDLELTDLDKAAADAILSAWGISGPAERAGIYALAGGNPLALRLAAQLSASGKLENSFSARVETMARRALGEGFIQGYFYDRVLNHIDDEAVRQLAHPGLALRYLTPEIVLEVLAGPCKLSITRIDEATSLLTRLKKYSQLVEPYGKGFRHRPDVRRAMLAALDQDHPGLVREINELAVDFHFRQNDSISRGEEIYHRLRLNQPEATLESRWVTGIVEDALKGSGPELPIRAQLYLISKRVQADIEGKSRSLEQIEQEMLNAEKAQDLLAHSLLNEARALIASQPRSPVSPLSLPLAQIEVLDRNWDAAQPLLDEAQRAALNTGQSADLEAALLLGAETAFRLGNAELSWKLAQRAEEVLVRSSRSDRLLWALIFEMRAAAGAGVPEEERKQIADRIRTYAAAQPDVRNPDLAQQMLPYVDSSLVRGVLKTALRNGLGRRALELLVDAIQKWIAGMELAKLAGPLIDSIQKVLKTGAAYMSPDIAGRLLTAFEDAAENAQDPSVVRAILNALAQGGDVPVFGVQDADLSTR